VASLREVRTTFLVGRPRTGPPPETEAQEVEVTVEEFFEWDVDSCEGDL